MRTYIYRVTHPFWGLCRARLRPCLLGVLLVVLVAAHSVAAAELVYVSAPIFVMMTNDVEMSRIEGPGEDFFFPRFARLLDESQARSRPDSPKTSAPLRSTP